MLYTIECMLVNKVVKNMQSLSSVTLVIKRPLFYFQSASLYRRIEQGDLWRDVEKI